MGLQRAVVDWLEDRFEVVEGVEAELHRPVPNYATAAYRYLGAVAVILIAIEVVTGLLLGLYDLLEQLTGSPVVTLNKAVATGMVDGPLAGLALLDGVAERLTGHYRLDAIRAHLLEMAGEREAAVAHYRAAASRTTSLPGQRYLAMRAARLNTRSGGI